MISRLNKKIINPTNLSRLGLRSERQFINYNLSYDRITELYKERNEGVSLNTPYGKVQNIDTGKYTGRSPADRWLVANEETSKNIWWGDINKKMKQPVFNELYDKCIDHFNGLENYYIFDGYCGTNPDTRKNVRFLTEYLWQHHFVKNMFIEPDEEYSPDEFQPDFTVINACNVTNPEWETHELNSEIFIAFNLDMNLGIIGGTHYGGCMKKGIFSLMNYHLPLQDIMTMHCSANIGKNGDTALFFGLSGTGKTTLSADPNRFLIGDDEHGWDDDGIFNLEGGCYAKTIDLSEKNEPDIYRAIKPNALLENVWFNEKYDINYSNTEKTQNGRVSYPLEHMSNLKEDGLGGHPKNIIFLTCDAYGILPPISKLNTGQAMYHFLSGYTAKVAGTERGINEPQSTFSAGFGAAFLPLHPSKYADLLSKKLEKHSSQVWLVNTGWSGGKYGNGKRMSIEITRNCIDAILENKLANTEYMIHPHFGFEIPTQVEGVESDILNPFNTWSDKWDYSLTCNKLISQFINNYKQYQGGSYTDYSQFEPKINGYEHLNDNIKKDCFYDINVGY